MFYLNQFELHLQESLLKKGFKYFAHHQVKEIEKDKLYIVQQFNIQLNVKNNQLKSYACQCQNDRYCEHLAATLFYIQEQKLHLQPSDFNFSQKQKQSKNTLTKFEAIQQIIFKASLVGFKNQKKTAAKTSHFEAFYDLLKSNIKSFHANEPLKQEQIDDLILVINQASHLITANNQADLSLDWSLACFVFFQFLFKYRFAGDEKALLLLKHREENNLHTAFEKGLSAKQKKAWFKAACWCLQSNQLIKGKGFYFLTVRYFIFSQNQEQLLQIEALIKKRKYVKPYDEDFDALAVLKIMLQFKLHGTPKKLLIDQTLPLDANYIVAYIDFIFLKKQFTKVFESLDFCLPVIKQKYPAYLRPFTSYVIRKSELAKNTNKTVEYLRYSFLHNQQLNPSELQNLMTLFSEKERISQIENLLHELYQIKIEEPVEKIILLLRYKNDKAALIQYLTKQNNQFHLLHQYLLEAPQFMTKSVITSYAKQLGKALQRANTYLKQKEVLQSCQVLFERLNTEQLSTLFNLLLVETGYESPCGKLLDQMFEAIAEKKQ